jgi:hypothetical protein
MTMAEPTTITILSEDDDVHEVVFLDVERHEDGPYLRSDMCGWLLNPSRYGAC